MSLKIIGVGFGRTGTLSTQHALNELGYNCYHMKEVMKKDNKNHLDFWVKVAEAPMGFMPEWDKLFHQYDATVDFPACCVWEQLVELNPEAKVILTLHPKGPEAWYKSIVETIYRINTMWESKLLSTIIPPVKKMRRLTSKLIWNKFLKGAMSQKETAISRYNDHIEEVKAKVPTNRLLIYSVDQGWKPLCDFLGKDVPEGDFPNVNDKIEMKKAIKLMSFAVRTVLFILLLFFSFLIWNMLA